MATNKEPRKRPDADLTHLGTGGKDYTVPFTVFLTAFMFFCITVILWRNGVVVFGGAGCGY